MKLFRSVRLGTRNSRPRLDFGRYPDPGLGSGGSRVPDLEAKRWPEVLAGSGDLEESTAVRGPCP